MAKELPYFKFYVSEWSDGDITLEDYEMQGLFINICAYYWSNECELTLKKCKKKFKHCCEESFASLIDSGVLKVEEDDNLVINFLDEQKKERDSLCSRNAKNARKRWGKGDSEIPEECDRIATASKSQCQVDAKRMQYREEKRREEEKREEKSNHSVPNSDSATPNKKEIFIKNFNEIRKSYLPKSTGVKNWTQKAEKNLKKFKGKGYTVGTVRKAIKAAFEDEHHQKHKWQYLTLEFITREDVMERYANSEGSSIEKKYEDMTLEEKAAKYLV